MSPKKATPAISIRSSTAEYLTFVAVSQSNHSNIEIRYEDKNVWFTQKMMTTLYDVTIAAINQHLKKKSTTTSLIPIQLLWNT